jgi:hypothetical protein
MELGRVCGQLPTAWVPVLHIKRANLVGGPLKKNAKAP